MNNSTNKHKIDNNDYDDDEISATSNGTFSVNLWMKFDNTSSYYGLFHYILSQDNTEVHDSDLWKTGGDWRASQIQIFLPAKVHAANGIVRVIARDDWDSQSDNKAFVDSDGIVSYNGPRARYNTIASTSRSVI
eukprot:scaffold84109_cov24-Prasinocladus_malaysianus.AAC.1